MIKRIVVTFIIVGFMLSCGFNENEGNLSVKQISLNTNLVKEVNFSEVFDKIQFVKISDEVMVGEILDLKIHENKIYILSNNALYIFNIKGKFLSKLDKGGEGPNEYSRIQDFQIVNENIEILDKKKEKMVTFDSLGNFVNSWRIKFFASKFLYLGDNNYAFYKGNILQTNKDYKIFILNKKTGKISIKYDRINKKQTNFLQFNDIQNFSSLKSSFNYFNSTSYLIHNFTNNNIEPKYKIDFGSENIDEKMLYKDYKDVSYFLEDFWKKDFSFLIDAFYETDKSIFFCFDKGRKRNHVFYNKITKNSIICNKLNDDIFRIFNFETEYINTPRTLFGSSLIYCLEVDQFLKELKKPQYYSKLLNKNPDLKFDKPIGALGMNPIIMIAHLK